MAERSSKWSFICYPDSAPDNWREILKAYHIPFAVSPLHDKDLNPTGDEKKAHWHVFIEFDSLKSFQQVSEVTKLCNGTIPQMVHSPIGMIRYFIHKDNPEKHQYDWADIEVYCGFDLEKYDAYTDSEIDKILSDITDFIDNNGITEYAELVAYSRSDRYDDWFRIIRRNTLFINGYITSRRNQYKEWKKTQQQ